MKDLNKHPWVQKVLNLFKQGLSADEMAKSIAMGALIGVIPLFGISTVTITAIADVWGDYVNIRCLFEDAHGNRYLRNIQRRGDEGYIIKKLGLDAKQIVVGQVFEV